MRSCVEQLVDESVSAEQKADFLCHLALKGETVDEIAWFAEAMRERAVKVPLEEAWRKQHVILDVCGTGGDRLNTFNISTTVSLICAAADVPVAKHGNRAITSQSGSADVLEALGIRIDLSPAEAARSLHEHHFAFCFAPNYHPAFKHISAARKLCATRGQRTIFNFLGPLLNPALPTAQLVGVPDPALCQPLARVLETLGVQRAMVVSGRVDTNGQPAHLDELSILGPNTTAQFYKSGSAPIALLDTRGLSLGPAQLSDLAGSDREINAAIVRRILNGAERGPKRHAVLLNCAAALLVADKVDTLVEGWALAGELIDTGRAARKLQSLQTQG